MGALTALEAGVDIVTPSRSSGADISNVGRRSDISRRLSDSGVRISNMKDEIIGGWEQAWTWNGTNFFSGCR
jgi:hypothetical protein